MSKNENELPLRERLEGGRKSKSATAQTTRVLLRDDELDAVNGGVYQLRDCLVSS